MSDEYFRFALCTDRPGHWQVDARMELPLKICAEILLIIAEAQKAEALKEPHTQGGAP